ncbi:MAG: alpha/beta fold hydrolase [Thermomicrobiales bacterium]
MPSRRSLIQATGSGLAAAAFAPIFARANHLPATPIASGSDVAGLIDIGGRSLFLERRGRGSPTVVFESGFRDSAASWSTDLLAESGVTPEVVRTIVLPGVAAFTSVVAYDRPGTILSRSDPVPMPHSATDVVNDLHMLLTTAQIPGPYVLVGHSLGGLFVRLYASIYPDEVAGLVLVDAWSEGLREALTSKDWRTYVDLGLAVPEGLSDYPDLETVDFEAVAEAMTQAVNDHPLPEIPLYVITAGLPFDISEADLGFSPHAWQDAWSTAQDQLAMLLPDARHVIAKRSGHNIQLDEPNLVTEAIRQVVDAVRDPESWSAKRVMPTRWAYRSRS